MIIKENSFGRIYLPKKFHGRYVSIEILSDKEVKKLKKDYEKSILEREKELKLHLNKLKELRGF